MTRPGLPKTRLEALVDGTAAIVLTLLILEVKVPHVALEELPHTLVEMRAEFAAFFVSVLVVGVFWLGHNQQMNFITHVDRTIVWLNVVGLGIVAFVPFTTALIGNYWGAALPTSLYGLNLAALGVLGYVQWAWATRGRHLVRADTPDETVRDVRLRIVVGTGLALAGAALAWWTTWASLVLYAAAFVPFAVRGKFDAHLRPAH